MAVGLSHGGYATTTEDLSSGNPVLPGSVWVIPEGPRTEGTAGPYPPGAGKLQGKSLSPRPPLRAWETIALPGACFSAPPDGTQWCFHGFRCFLVLVCVFLLIECLCASVHQTQP